MRAILIAAASLVCSVATAAPNWDVIGGNDKSSVEVDRSSIRARDGYRQGWTRWNHIPQKEHKGRKYTSALVLYHADCKNSEMTYSQANYYAGTDGEGEQVLTENYPRASLAKDMQEQAPGTVGEQVLKALCGR